MPGSRKLAEAYAAKRARIDEAARLARTVTAKSRFLMEGDRVRPPYLVQRQWQGSFRCPYLRGELVFEDGRASACLFHASLSDVFLNRQIRDRSAALGAKLDLPLESCGVNDLTKQDLIFAEREASAARAGRSRDRLGRCGQRQPFRAARRGRREHVGRD